MPVTPITDFGTAVITGIAAAFAAFFSALPSILGAILLLIVGWIIAGAIGGLVAKALRAIHFDQVAARAGVTTFLARAQVRADPAGVVGGTVTWYVRLVFVLLAANAVGLTALSTVVNGILAFIPNLLVAVFILGAFSWLAGLTRNVVRGALGDSSLPNADAIAAIAYAAVFAFGVVAAADQVGVASTLINTLFMGVVAALALAFGLAFGLGGRDEAAQIWRDWRGHASKAMQSSGGVTERLAPVASGDGVARADAGDRLRREELARRG
ncbi:MAG TPA: small-conductance mechanosensitive ion channel [Candidatus Limnocylindria bacterium]|nr:small-conductance mechanosensitive ion channel [Candidatus Limnocylindria bacterium]